MKQQIQRFNQSALLDFLKEKLSLKNDAKLALELNVTPSAISNMRANRISIGCTLLLSIHELTNIPIKELRSIMGDNRESYFK